MGSKNWAQNNIEVTDGLSRPWLLIRWRLKLLQDQRVTLNPETRLAQLHPALMILGLWWQMQEAAVFGTEHPPGERG